jgi:hypothetical protein
LGLGLILGFLICFMVQAEFLYHSYSNNIEKKMTKLKMNYKVIHYLFETKNFEMKGIQMCHPNKKI